MAPWSPIASIPEQFPVRDAVLHPRLVVIDVGCALRAALFAAPRVLSEECAPLFVPFAAVSALVAARTTAIVGPLTVVSGPRTRLGAWWRPMIGASRAVESEFGAAWNAADAAHSPNQRRFRRPRARPGAFSTAEASFGASATDFSGSDGVSGSFFSCSRGGSLCGESTQPLERAARSRSRPSKSFPSRQVGWNRKARSICGASMRHSSFSRRRSGGPRRTRARGARGRRCRRPRK